MVTACLAEFTVRAILQADRERSALLDVLVRFTADAAHELRSPITAIQTVAEVALAQPRSEREYRRSIETVLRSSRKLIRLTDALLLLASEDAGALTVSGDPVDLSDLVEEALDRWRKRAADSGRAPRRPRRRRRRRGERRRGAARPRARQPARERDPPRRLRRDG